MFKVFVYDCDCPLCYKNPYHHPIARDSETAHEVVAEFADRAAARRFAQKLGKIVKRGFASAPQA